MNKVDYKTSVRSLIWAIRSYGANIEPCGIPCRPDWRNDYLHENVFTTS